MRIHPDLPIYYLDGLSLPVLYTPGTLAVVERGHAELISKAWRESTALPDDPRIRQQMEWLAGYARKTTAARTLWLEEEFEPHCLTVYLSNRCNLNCPYCFAATGLPKDHRAATDTDSFSLIDTKCFSAAARLVAENCRHKQLPFQLVLHGGGEPTLHWSLLLKLVRSSKAIAAEHGVQWTGYIATNGVLPLEQAQVLGATFQRIGLSCDGPPDIQDRQRPLPGNGPTSQWVRQTAGAIHAEGADLEIRATITPETISRQKEILLYLAQELGAATIRFEPEYALDGADRDTKPRVDPEHWAACFMEAKHVSISLGVDLSFSGIRLDELHGPYCNTLRQSLHLTPDGKVSSCFFCVDGSDSRYQNRIIGQINRNTGKVQLNHKKIARLHTQASRIDDTCHGCFAAYHCSRACPEICAVKGKVSAKKMGNSFRCRLNQLIGSLLIEVAAEDTCHSSTTDSVEDSQPSLPAEMATVLADAPAVTRQTVIKQWRAVRKTYNFDDKGLPSPLWQEKGFQYDEQHTWLELRRIIAETPLHPMSVYLHLPFCEKRCDFCDCYSFRTPANHRLHREYSQLLLRDIRHWAELEGVRTRPVTTVHFGGGTPNHLAPEHFQSIIQALHTSLTITAETEWALESTATLLTEEQLVRLQELNFRRLHIGVQTLEEPLRQRIGRQQPVEKVLTTIENCLQKGFITTVDLLYGMPGETSYGFFAAVNTLIAAGIHGISFYRFNRSTRNQRFLGKLQYPQSNSFHDYAMFLVVDQMMNNAGFDKNHFCHYGLNKDQNLYYTHARRGEDLLALGASADGVFSGFHYRNPHLSRKSFEPRNSPLFQGGIAESPTDRMASTIVAQLMTGSIGEDVAKQLELSNLLATWQVSDMIEKTSREDKLLRLTGNGSWFICQMIQELQNTLIAKVG